MSGRHLRIYLQPSPRPLNSSPVATDDCSQVPSVSSTAFLSCFDKAGVTRRQSGRHRYNQNKLVIEWKNGEVWGRRGVVHNIPKSHGKALHYFSRIWADEVQSQHLSITFSFGKNLEEKNSSARCWSGSHHLWSRIPDWTKPNLHVTLIRVPFGHSVLKRLVESMVHLQWTDKLRMIDKFSHTHTEIVQPQPGPLLQCSFQGHSNWVINRKRRNEPQYFPLRIDGTPLLQTIQRTNIPVA